MRIWQTIWALAHLFAIISAIAIPSSFESIADSAKELYKRKGGGGGRGGGSGSSGSSSSSGGSGGRSGSGGSSLTSSSSNTGGRTSSGSGPPPSYGGGRYYGGGASVPYAAGAPRGGINPIFLGAGLGAFGGLWLYGAYAYSYPGYYYYYNRTANRNESSPVDCVCGRYQSCGCDANNDTDYMTSVANNASIAQKQVVNGTDTLVINGTLPNGTTAVGAEGAALALRAPVLEFGGIWLLVGGVAAAVSVL